MNAYLLGSIIPSVNFPNELPVQVNSKHGGQGNYFVRSLPINLPDMSESSTRNKPSRTVCWFVEACKPSYHVKLQSYCNSGCDTSMTLIFKAMAKWIERPSPRWLVVRTPDLPVILMADSNPMSIGSLSHLA